ncbi:hypothetical protein KC363_g24 [Hortaea werneckii]|nr:hypothetical protein KC363_g24 [Hortaea werneckii]
MQQLLTAESPIRATIAFHPAFKNVYRLRVYNNGALLELSAQSEGKQIRQEATIHSVKNSTYIRLVGTNARALSYPLLNLRDTPQLQIQLLLLVLELETLVGIELRKHVPSLTIELQYPAVVLPQTSAVAYSHQCDIQTLRFIVDQFLNVWSQGASALVQNGNISPFSFHIQAQRSTTVCKCTDVPGTGIVEYGL